MTDIKGTIERLESSAGTVIAAQRAVRDACGVGEVSDSVATMRLVNGFAFAETEAREAASLAYLKEVGDPRTILALTTAFKELEAERDRLRAERDAQKDLSYAYGFCAGWNAGVSYENCQEVPYPRTAGGDPEKHLALLDGMEDRIESARAALKALEPKP